MSFVVKPHVSVITREVLKCVIRQTRRNSASSAAPTSDDRQGKLKMMLKAAGLGVAVGGAYAWYSLTLPDKVSAGDMIIQQTAKSIPSLPKVTFARQIQVPADKSGLELILFQYPTCPFCCKVRAFLDFYGISYKVVEVDPVMRQQIKWSEYKKVPILLARSENGYMQLNDSTMIISCLATLLKSKKKLSLDEAQQYYPLMGNHKNEDETIINKYFVMDGKVDPKQVEIDKDERQWRRWADEVLVHTLSPNVYRTTEEALQAFNWFSDVGEWDRLFPRWERNIIVYVGAYAMYFVGKRLKKKYILKDNVRLSLYDECNHWLKEVKKRGKFFGGSSPNLADLAVYGVLSSIEGCLAFKELQDNTKIGTWYHDMKTAVQSHNGINTLS